MKQERRIPTIFALLIIALGIFGTSFLVQNLRPFLTKATPSEVPQEIKITNVADSSFTVSWVTQDEVAGSIRFWENKNQELISLDERDKASIIGFYKTHHVTVGSLKPGIIYFFVINSGKNSFNNNGVPYEVTTGPQLANIEHTISLKGTVINDDGSAGRDSVAYISIKNAQSLSTLTSQKGEWLLRKSVRTADISDYYDVKDSDILEILITNGNKNSNIKVNLSSTIPTITLGQNYDFTTIQTIKESTSSSQKTSPTFPTTSPSQSITTPKIAKPEEGENFTDAQPRFSGTAPKGATIKITIQSTEPIEQTVKADSSGHWSYRPSSPFAPGEHTITIIAPDSNGILRTISHNFKVFAAGEQVTQSATPSATPTSKPLPTVVATPTAVSTEIPIPTKAPSPIPVTGDNLPLIVLSAFGAITFLIGLILLF